MCRTFFILSLLVRAHTIMFASFAARRALSSSSSSPLSVCSSSSRRSFVATTIRGVSAGTLSRQTTNDLLGAEAEELAFAPNKSPKHNQLFAPSDPIFMSQFLYNSAFIKKQMSEASSNNKSASGEKECAKMLAQIGGHMKSYYKATTGEYDGLVIYSFPKNHDVHTFEQIVKSSGLIEKVYTTKLMTSEDSDVALRAAKELVDKYGGGSAGL